MKTWRAKFVLLLIVYFAGFATAIYCLAPAPDNQQNLSKSTIATAGLDSSRFAQTFNAGMHSFIDFAKRHTKNASVLIKQKIQERKNDSL